MTDEVVALLEGKPRGSAEGVNFSSEREADRENEAISWTLAPRGVPGDHSHMFRGAADEIWGRAGSNRVQTVFASDVGQLQDFLLRELRERDDVASVISVTWEEAPGLKNELDAVVDAMARAALSIWPRWYSSPIARFEQRDDPLPDLEQVISRAKQQTLQFSEAWTKRVWARCQKNKLPLSKKVVAAEQVRQLALAIDPANLMLVVTVLRPEAKKGRLQTLARALEWMAAQSGAPLVFLAPVEWKDRSELDVVNFEAIDADAMEVHSAGAQDEGGLIDPSADESGVILSPSRKLDETSRSLQNAAHSLFLKKSPRDPIQAGVVVEPFFGKPHPNSQVENYLEEHLALDEELRPLFTWNHPMPLLGSLCSVDLLWEDGRLVIELDGSSHLKPLQYNKDRGRDYLLLLGGYTTVRITNESVISNVALVIEQIRNVVRLLQAKGIANIHGTEPQAGTRAVAHAHG